jgi:hypothetical protein
LDDGLTPLADRLTPAFGPGVLSTDDDHEDDDMATKPPEKPKPPGKPPKPQPDDCQAKTGTAEQQDPNRDGPPPDSEPT